MYAAAYSGNVILEETYLYEKVPNYYLFKIAEIRGKKHEKIIKEHKKRQEEKFIKYIMLLSKIAFKCNLPVEIVIIISSFFSPRNKCQENIIEISKTIYNRSFFYLTIKKRIKKCSSIEQYNEKYNCESKMERRIVKKAFNAYKKCCSIL